MISLHSSLLRLKQSVHCWEKPLDYEETHCFYSVSFLVNDLILQLLPLMIGTEGNFLTTKLMEQSKQAYLQIPECWCTVNKMLHLRDIIIKFNNNGFYTSYICLLEILIVEFRLQI